jgi:hypothetical protein
LNKNAKQAEPQESTSIRKTFSLIKRKCQARDGLASLGKLLYLLHTQTNTHTHTHTHTQIEDWSVVLDIPQRTCAKKKKSDFPA